MKIALFAAVPEEVGSWADHVNFTGIGRENATRTALSFMRRHAGEKITVVNFGTVGAHHLPVGTVLSINEITSAGRIFDPNPMLTDHFSVPAAQGLPTATLFSSDSFVSPSVYTADYLQRIQQQADCFDMESSALYTVVKQFDVPYVSFKIVSDNLDVDIDEWHRRVVELSKSLCVFMEKLIGELSENEPVEFIK
ncbi:MAG: hypothetical protein J6X65_05335 [Bacteroidales bacterium]|jgi:nucleoside phosphorylase|nr:hypothetical protein [Bacteroidales bacterium]